MLAALSVVVALSLLQGVSIFEACLVAQWPDYPLYVLLQIDESPAGDFGESTLHRYIIPVGTTPMHDMSS